MTIEQAAAFLIFAAVAAITPGPSNVMLTAAGAAVGVRRGLPCLFGVTLGMGLMMFAVPLGLGRIVLGHTLAMAGLKWGGAAFLLWLAWKIATAPGGHATGEHRSVGFFEAAVFQWINPKSWLVSVSVAGAYLNAEPGRAVVQAALLGALFVVAALPCCLVWLAFGATVERLLRGPRARKALNIALGALLAFSVALIVR